MIRFVELTNGISFTLDALITNGIDMSRFLERKRLVLYCHEQIHLIERQRFYHNGCNCYTAIMRSLELNIDLSSTLYVIVTPLYLHFLK